MVGRFLIGLLRIWMVVLGCLSCLPAYLLVTRYWKYNNIEVQNIFDLVYEMSFVDLVYNKIIDPEKIFDDIKKDHKKTE